MSALTSQPGHQDHETFKSRLVDDVFGKDTHGRVQMEKVMMLVWQFRDDPTVVQFMAQFVAKFSGSRDVFAGIEFYLPQLAHMIIHLEVDWDDAILERFALIIAQQSLHFALQLNWILQGAIEDYEPELPSGDPNPYYNPLFYSRCVKLLTNIERCVVYGRPRSMELQRLYEHGKITKREYEILEQADRRFNAFQITGSAGDATIEPFGGELLYKRRIRRGRLCRKHWKSRYFCVEERMLNCYNVKDGNLVRSMPLEGATIGVDPDGKYPHMFHVQNRNFHFVIRAMNDRERDRWVEQLKEEACAHALFLNDSLHDTNDTSRQVLRDLTPTQRTRFDFFKDERDFIRHVCDIAERLRFNERVERKRLAPGMMENLHIPHCVYLPLCNSTDIWRRVQTTVPKDTKVFNTKERCPVIMYFVVKRGEQMNHHRGGMKDVNLDVAEYLHLQFDVRDDEKMTVIEEKADEEIGEEVILTPLASRTTDTHDDEEEARDPLQDSIRSAVSSVWHDLDYNGGHALSRSPSGVKGNRQVQSFLRENLVSLPRKLATRIESRRKFSTRSILDKATLPMESVPIVESRSIEYTDANSIDGQSVVSIERGSLLATGNILLGDQQEGDIDLMSIERAKELICHGETWAEKSARMLREIGNGEAEGVLEIASLMAKSNDDLRQEVFVMQMIHYYKSVFAKADLPLWLKTYSILSASKDTGLIEVITDASSIDGLKKSQGYPKEGGLRAYFEQTYGNPKSKSFKAAQKNFMQSLAAYSLVSYLLGLKDRHNGNIMIDTRGHLIFIDFGFAMGMAPGHEFSMERAPFKLTKEYLDVMDGSDSECFTEFKRLFVAGFEEARNSSQIALGLVEIMMYKSNYPCFTGVRYGHGVALKKFEKRLMLRTPDSQVKKRALALIEQSRENYGTWLYDVFQQRSNGYAM